MEGTRLKDLSLTIEKSGEVKMDMEEITATNLAMLVLGDVSVNEDGETEVTIFSRDSLTGALQYYATNEVGPRWYVELLSVTFNPAGDFSPITDNAFAKLPVTGTVQAVDGVFGKMMLKPLGRIRRSRERAGAQHYRRDRRGGCSKGRRRTHRQRRRLGRLR